MSDSAAIAASTDAAMTRRIQGMFGYVEPPRNVVALLCTQLGSARLSLGEPAAAAEALRLAALLDPNGKEIQFELQRLRRMKE